MRIILVAIFALFSSIAVAEDAQPAAAPQWFLSEIAALAADGGRWIADNSAYKNEQEKWDAYGIEWKSSFDGTTLSGRLYAIKDGKEIGDFWEFRQYWHPGRKEGVVEQFGWGGVVGAGKVWRDGDATKMDQVFFTADGGQSRTGHIGRFPDANTHITESFAIEGDEWKPNRKYVWKRVTP